MLLVCPNCATSYMLDEATIGPAGRTVRCARCKTSWFAGGPEAVPELAAAADVAQSEAQPAFSARGKAPPPPAAPEPAQAAAGDSESLVTSESEAPPAEPQPEFTPIPAETQAVEPEPALIADAPPLVPPIENDSPPPATAEAVQAEGNSEDVESFDARRRRLQARRKQSRRSSRWTAIILVLIGINVTLVGARSEVVRYLPQTASLFAAIGLPVNLRGLQFEDVKISDEVQNGLTILNVQGVIVSAAGKPVEVPRLRFAARNASGQEVYTWTMPPPRSILEPGERLPFHSQVPAPKVDARDIMVRFFSAKDAGVK
jgi:predicted Zn finger-like uncharacterized protein